MASNQTSHLGLNQWSAEDQVLRTEFNADNRKIDEAVALLGNCRIVQGSYVGTGKAGADYPCQLSFGFKPMIVFMNTNQHYPESEHLVWTRPGLAFTYPMDGSVIYHPTWEDRGIQWYATAGGVAASANQQLNVEGVEYHYTVLGVLE